MTLRALLLAAFAVAGCAERALDHCEGVEGPFDLGGDASLTTNDCPVEAQLVYVIDEGRTLASFRPDTLTFATVGVVDCPVDPQWVPFSMAVQRDGTAWVLFASPDLADSALFRVDVKDASCAKSGYARAADDPVLFGMGFALDSPAGASETLFLAEYVDRMNLPPLRLLSMRLTDFQLTQHGFVDGDAELTSTPDSNLFGYFPGFDQSIGPRVEQVDKGSGKPIQSFFFGGIGSQFDGDVAVAAWGGVFWIFVGNTNNARHSAVFRYAAGDANATLAIPDSGRIISGAGVSTCKNGS